MGFVVQQFDTETRKFTNQEFIAEDGCEWETTNGDSLGLEDDAELIYGKGGVDEPEFPLNMIQP